MIDPFERDEEENWSRDARRFRAMFHDEPMFACDDEPGGDDRSDLPKRKGERRGGRVARK